MQIFKSCKMKYYCPCISYDSVALREESRNPQRSMTHSQDVCKKIFSYKSSNCAYINVLFMPIKHALCVFNLHLCYPWAKIGLYKTTFAMMFMLVSLAS